MPTGMVIDELTKNSFINHLDYKLKYKRQVSFMMISSFYTPSTFIIIIFLGDTYAASYYCHR